MPRGVFQESHTSHFTNRAIESDEEVYSVDENDVEIALTDFTQASQNKRASSSLSALSAPSPYLQTDNHDEYEIDDPYQGFEVC